MQHDDEFGFWDADPDWTQSSSTARVAIPRPTAAQQRAKTILWRRIGALAVVGAVAATVAFVVSGSSSAPRLKTAEEAHEAVAIDTPDITTPPSLEIQGVAGQAVVVPVVAPDALGAVAPVAQIAAASNQAVAAGNQVEAATATTVAACAKSYTVVAGDYWILIAHKQSVSLKDLLAANHATTSTPLYTRRAICLPANAKAASTSSTTKATTTTTKSSSSNKKSTTTTVKVTESTAKPTPAKVSSTVPKTTVTPTTVKATKTTTATTVPPSTTAAPPKNTYTRAQAEQIIRDVWPDDLEDKAVSIATRESNLIPVVRNSCCFGLFQIYFQANRASLVAAGITSQAMLYDPRVNATAAYMLYLRSGWAPWGG